MNHVLTKQQIQSVASMNEEALYQYFIQQSVEHKQVWGLRDEEGFGYRRAGRVAGVGS